MFCQAVQASYKGIHRFADFLLISTLNKMAFKLRFNRVVFLCILVREIERYHYVFAFLSRP